MPTPRPLGGIQMKGFMTIVALALAPLAACSQQPDAKALVWPSDEEVFGIEPGGTIRATGMKQLMDKCRALQLGELPSDPDEDKSCEQLHTLLMETLENRKSGGNGAGGP